MLLKFPAVVHFPPESPRSASGGQVTMKFVRVGFVGMLVLGVAVIAACAPTASTAPTSAPPTAAATAAPPPTTAPEPTAMEATTAPEPTSAPEATTAAEPTTEGGASMSPGQNPPAAKAITLQLAQNDELGSFLVDQDGYTLYMFTKDVKGTSNCYDQCLTAWPALLTEGEPTLKEGLIADLVSTTTRKDGSVQLTYNGWPLYYYQKDMKPGDVTGQAVGNVWWVVSAEGNVIKPSGLTVAQDDKYGQFLADENGMSLYMFTKDTENVSNCYDQCEVAWPPLLTLTGPEVGDGVDSAMLGETTRKDGTKQVTYNGMPLYYWEKDLKPGDTTGQNVGTVWFLVAPDGKVIETKP
jgi:predicted lipoprotein with Yx(FWY)xxD motif